MYAEHIPAKGSAPVLEQKPVQMVGEGVGFEPAIWWVRLTVSTTVNAPKREIASNIAAWDAEKERPGDRPFFVSGFRPLRRQRLSPGPYGSVSRECPGNDMF